MKDRRNSGMTERLAQLALVAISSVIVLAVVELALRSFWPLADPHRYWRLGNDFIRSQHAAYFTRRLEAEPGLPGVSGTSRYTTNNMGFRGRDIAARKPPDEYRIFLIGGSSMECFVLDDGDSIDAVLENHLTAVRRGSVRVYNAGKSGDRTDDHVAILSQRIVHLEPDLIVVFAGINDLRGVIANHDYLHEGAREINPWSLAITETQLGRALYYGYKSRRFEREIAEEQVVETPYWMFIRAQNAAPPAPALPVVNATAYGNNLRTIAGIARAHDINLVLMTQQTTWASDVDPSIAERHSMRLIEGLVYAEVDMHLAMETLNDVMRGIAEDFEVPLYDLAETLPKASTHFYDDVHFNVRGARDAALGLSTTIIEQGWLTE
jgi:lysophospholipase L1-like esterase